MASKNQSGFSLIEVIIAITILAFMMTSVYVVISQQTETKDTVTKEDREYLQVFAAIERIRIDFTQIYSPLYHSHIYTNKKKSNNYNNQFTEDEAKPKFTPSERFASISVNFERAPVIQNEQKDHLRFLSLSNRRKFQDSKESEFNWVEYKTRKMEKDDLPTNQNQQRPEGALELIRIVDNIDPFRKDFSQMDQIREQVLLRNIKDFRFTFWDPKKEKFVESMKYLPSKNTLKAIMIEIEWYDLDGTVQSFKESIRPLYPSFDTQKDEEEKEKFRKPKGSSGRSNEINDEDQDEDE